MEKKITIKKQCYNCNGTGLVRGLDVGRPGTPSWSAPATLTNEAWVCPLCTGTGCVEKKIKVFVKKNPADIGIKTVYLNRNDNRNNVGGITLAEYLEK